MGYDIRYLYPKTLDQDAGNYWFYEGDRANNTLADIVVNGFFNGSTVRDSDLIKVKATDGKSLLTIMIENGSVNTEVAGSGASASEVIYDDSVSPPYGASNVQAVLDILKTSSGSMLINNYRSVATNGVDSASSPISLTLNNALTNVGSSGVIQVYDGSFDVPTVSLLDKQIIGIDKEKCILRSTSGVLPVANNDNTVISNIYFMGTFGNPIPVVIAATGLNLIYNNCIFDGNGSTSCSISNWAGTITFNDCIFADKITISGNSAGNVIFNDCDIIDCSITLTSGSLASIILNNSTYKISNWSGGALNINNCRMNNDSDFGANNDTNNYLYINGGSTRNMFANSLSYHTIVKSGTAPFLINNLDTVDTLNVYNGNGVINGFNDTTRVVNTNYNLQGYDSLILADATAGDITITLFLTSNFAELNNLKYEIIKTDDTANKVILVVTNPDVFANGDIGSTTQYSLIHKNDAVAMVAYPLLSTWRRL